MTGEIITTAGRLETTLAVGPQLFSILRTRIVRGELVPGTRLSEADLALRYGTSRQPVREAFIRLAEASLIEIRPQRGSYVRRIDLAAVTAAQFVREAVEADIVRRVAMRADPAALDDLDRMLGQQARLAEIDDPQSFTASDEAFHRHLARMAGQGGGWDVLQSLKTQMDRVRYLSLRHFPRLELVRQHRQVVEAIRAGDPDAAEAHMRNHLRQILNDLSAMTETRPDLFDGAAT